MTKTSGQVICRLIKLMHVESKQAGGPVTAKTLPIAIIWLFFSTFIPFAKGAAILRSPWDGQPVKLTTAPYDCPETVHLPPDLVTDGFYKDNDPTHSIIDPAREEAYKKSSGPIKNAGEEIVRDADAYRTTGSRAAANCAMRQIVSLARENAIAGRMSSNQAYYVQGWVAGAIAIAYLKILNSGMATPEERTLIAAWLTRIGDATKDYYAGHDRIGHGDAHNNHRYWAGVELVAIAVAAQNHSDFDWAIAAYDDGVSAIQADGTLPNEMSRGQRALHYHLYALAPLVLIAEFGAANGMDLYGHANGAIHHLAEISVHGLSDPSLFEKRTGVAQEVPAQPSGDAIGWAPPYLRRFPDPLLASLVHSARSLSVFYLGGLPPT
jgi:poly(beta-D-mannuronate) lyase